MSLGPSFLNLFDTPDAALGPDELLRRAIGSRDDASSPCTFWVSRVVRLGERHALPRSVILAFAPGAGLIVTKPFTVRGLLDAGLEPRFELVDDGVVELLGPLEEIVADWWRPSLGRNPVEHALAALWTRYLHDGVLPAPIRLDGPYALTRPLRVLPPDTLTGRVDVVLRGQHGRPLDPPTFVDRSTSRTEALPALVTVEGDVVLTLEHVAFDGVRERGAPLATACLSLEGTFSRSRIEACSFRFGHSGLRVSPQVQHWTELVAGTGDTAEGVRLRVLGEAIRRSTWPPNRLSVSRCLFTGVSVIARAIDVGLGAPTSLAVRDTQFVGTYANAVAILAGEVNLTACGFASEAPPTFLFNTADVLIRRWGDDAGPPEVWLEPKNAPAVRVADYANPVNVHGDQALANTHLTITHCVSTSPTFLIMNQTFAYDDTFLGGAALINVRHTPGPNGLWSVRVGAGAPQRALMLQGCRFGGSVMVEPGSAHDVVVDLGTRFVGTGRFEVYSLIGLATRHG